MSGLIWINATGRDNDILKPLLRVPDAIGTENALASNTTCKVLRHTSYNAGLPISSRGEFMSTLRFVVAVAGAVAAGMVLAQSGADVVKAKGCLNCHAVDQKKIGPAYKDVAAKYKGDAKAGGMLAGKLKEGKGHPKIEASDAEIKAAVDYVLSQK